MAGIFGWHFRAPKATAFASLRCLVQILIFVDVFSQCYNASKATASRFDPVALSLSLSRHGFGCRCWYRGCCRLYALRLASAGIVAHTRHGFGWLRLVSWLLLSLLVSYAIATASASLSIHTRKPAEARHGFGWLRLAGWLCFAGMLCYTLL